MCTIFLFTCLIHPVILQSSHVIMECVVWIALKVCLKQDGVDINHLLTSCLELSKVLVEMGICAVNIAIFLLHTVSAHKDLPLVLSQWHFYPGLLNS